MDDFMHGWGSGRSFLADDGRYIVVWFYEGFR